MRRKTTIRSKKPTHFNPTQLQLHRFSTALNKPAPLTAEQTLKFTTYLLSRRSVLLPKGASLLLEALATIVRQPKLSPICIQPLGNGLLATDATALSIRIVDVLGAAVQPAFATVSATLKSSDGTTTATVPKAALQVRSSDATVYSLDVAAAKLARGSYTVHVQAGDALTQTLAIRVLGRVRVQQLEIGVGESDSTAAIRKETVPFQAMLAHELQADAQQKLALRVVLVDEQTDKPIAVQQVFVRLEHKQNGEEIIYVAELDAQRAYKFELDVGARAADFAQRSGAYALELIVGDASLTNAFRWLVADVQLRFAGEPKTESVAQLAAQRRSKLPAIEHTFRVPEPRPLLVVSTLFTALCAAPLLVLLVLWTRLGVNVSNFPLSISAIGFHGGFGAILALFGVFFWRLNMFETIRYLVPLAVVTFFFGNRLLRAIAAGGGKA